MTESPLLTPIETAARPVSATGRLPAIGEWIAPPVHHDMAGTPRRVPQETA
ncbi:hypothetical protein [Streptomyces lushanensis]|uniref:hypothetical protein n=1 Tax=Streptomyces lushanensis TaxID=1434255 RepID=UPI00147318B0|nr:hypothetical protein [Streptomyces lushanensis]